MFPFVNLARQYLLKNMHSFKILTSETVFDLVDTIISLLFPGETLAARPRFTVPRQGDRLKYSSWDL